MTGGWRTMRELRCPEHADAQVRRCRTQGSRGRGIYPECVPNDGSPRHALSWEEATSTVPSVEVEVQLAPGLAGTPLTQSELIVLREAANGYTSAETARRLGKGTQTVKTQRCRILLKLHAANTAQAVCIATEAGILVVERGPVSVPRAPQRRLQLVRS
jgi:DNA-binding NarL/FixJ family response regulator